jgi:hypothetical protein
MGHLKRRTYLRGFLLGRSFYRAAEAMDFAAHLHTGVRKDGTTPEFAHQIYIVSYLSTLLPHLRHPEETLAVGFLHDVVEDCGVPVTEIEARFGTLIAEATDAMSKEVGGVKRSSESVVQMREGRRARFLLLSGLAFRVESEGQLANPGAKLAREHDVAGGEAQNAPRRVWSALGGGISELGVRLSR